jgi:hypothetical protein
MVDHDDDDNDDVSAKEFAQGHKGLMHLLRIIEKEGGEISTRKLLEAMDNWGYHGQHLIRIAEKEGFIEREVGVEPGPGQFDPMYNSLTSKGKKLLSRLNIEDEHDDKK